ncbi:MULTISPECIES: rhodanese-like domain-containing protein [Glaesserella]|uniref:Rhodanese-like domain-containing protein n=1 Tax=Glaesserella australis TaxID=2094024 RepID=A0A328BZZ0_9PAST|nr:MULTISPECIES: rhodanese-like domain-containing protein [Glaesserella]AUI66213.1 hypothetical protein CJD39_06290 [Glaesserella sp. 15-184]RAL19235.1 rhodanese-like domain-containing protein [Glaesserella australis]
MKKLSYLTLLLGAVLGGQPVYAEQTIAQQTKAQTQSQKAQGIWIDVRSAEEYQSGHLQGALNVSHGEIATQIAKISPNKDEPIHLYCRSGRRSELALIELKKLGYTNVTNHGGYAELIQKGLK